MFDPSYYVKRFEGPGEQVDLTVLNDLPLDRLTSMVDRAALSNSEKRDEAIRQADSYSFQIAHPEFVRCEKNTKLMNHWLESRGITNPEFPDFQAAFDSLNVEGLLTIEKNKIPQEGVARSYVGVFTKQRFDDLDTMIAAERHASLNRVTTATPEEKAFDSLSIEQQELLLREGERQEQLKLKRSEVRKESDAWLSLHPEYVDSDRNAKLMKVQLRANGVAEGSETIADFEIANKQLRESGLLTLNRSVLKKQEQDEVRQRAQRAVATPGSIFDTTTIEEMELLPLDEVRRRANGNYSGF